jgi:hypothetical protein
LPLGTEATVLSVSFARIVARTSVESKRTILFSVSWGSRENRSNSLKVLGTQIRARTWKKCIDWKVLVGICTDVEKGHEVLQDLWID